MINRQVRQFYIDKENAEHSITDRLIRGGYVQPAGGYILNAKRAGVKDPSQYWQLSAESLSFGWRRAVVP